MPPRENITSRGTLRRRLLSIAKRARASDCSAVISIARWSHSQPSPSCAWDKPPLLMVDGTGDVHVYQQACSCGQFDIPVMAAVVRGGQPPMVVGDDELSPDQWSCLELTNSTRDLQENLQWQIAEARRRSSILR